MIKRWILVVYPALITIFLLSTGKIYSEEGFVGLNEVESINWGGVENGWKKIFSIKNVSVVRGPDGKLGLEISDNQPELDSRTDLLIHFDDIRYGYTTVNGVGYGLEFSNIFPSYNIRVFGKGAAAFRRLGNRVEISLKEDSLFYPGKRITSFSIDFYLYPTMIFNDSTVLSFRAPSIVKGGQYTGFRAYFENGKLKWRFEGLFRNKDGKDVDVSIEELEDVPLYEWHHHTLYYDSKSGMIILYVDGKESAIKWLTDNGTESGTLLYGKIPETNLGPLIIGESFLGFMDEFRIYKGALEEHNGLYKDQGVVLSDVIEFKTRNVKIAALDWMSDEKNGTAVRLYYRYSNNYFLPYDDINQTRPKLVNTPEWEIAKRGERINIETRYFQWKAVLYGTERRFTPVLNGVVVYYQPDFPPVRPILLEAIPGNKSVKLKWVLNKEPDIAGYKIYYGLKSGTYFGKGAEPGDSPIFVKNINSIIIKNLKNEQVYFFALTAVDKSGQESSFSRELSSRPSVVYSLSN